MSMIAIITARGGSKRIPKKNIKEFCGKPMIAYSILTAIQTGFFDEVMVSTDSEEIAEIAKQYGASVPFMRSEEASSDFATTDDVLREVLNTYRKMDRFFDYFCCIYPTAPLLNINRLKEAEQLLKNTGADAVVPVVRFSYPPQRAYVIEEGKLVFQYPEYSFFRSQDLTPIFHDAGQFYFYKTDAFFQKKGLVCENTVPIILSEMEVQDIDNDTDWKMAEMKYNLLRK